MPLPPAGTATGDDAPKGVTYRLSSHSNASVAFVMTRRFRFVRRASQKASFLIAGLAVAGLCGVAQAAPAGDVEAGRTLFKALCASCHTIGPMAASGFAPQLNGIVGRRAASLTDFDYTPAMRKSGITWDEKTLAKFIAGPSDLVPGTRMRFWGMGNERKQADLIAYLRTLK